MTNFLHRLAQNTLHSAPNIVPAFSSENFSMPSVQTWDESVENTAEFNSAEEPAESVTNVIENPIAEPSLKLNNSINAANLIKNNQRQKKHIIKPAQTGIDPTVNIPGFNPAGESAESVTNIIENPVAEPSLKLNNTVNATNNLIKNNQQQREYLKKSNIEPTANLAKNKLSNEFDIVSPIDKKLVDTSVKGVSNALRNSQRQEKSKEAHVQSIVPRKNNLSMNEVTVPTLTEQTSKVFINETLNSSIKSDKKVVDNFVDNPPKQNQQREFILHKSKKKSIAADSTNMPLVMNKQESTQSPVVRLYEKEFNSTVASITTAAKLLSSENKKHAEINPENALDKDKNNLIKEHAIKAKVIADKDVLTQAQPSDSQSVIKPNVKSKEYSTQANTQLNKHQTAKLRQTNVSITIGRIEVRAAKPTAPVRATQRNTKPALPILSLKEYMGRYKTGDDT